MGEADDPVMAANGRMRTAFGGSDCCRFGHEMTPVGLDASAAPDRAQRECGARDLLLEDSHGPLIQGRCGHLNRAGRHNGYGPCGTGPLACAGASARGSHSVNVLPWSGELSTAIVPPWSSANRRAIARPRPTPPSARLRD